MQWNLYPLQIDTNGLLNANNGWLGSNWKFKKIDEERQDGHHPNNWVDSLHQQPGYLEVPEIRYGIGATQASSDR